MHKEIQDIIPVKGIFQINCKTATQMIVISEHHTLTFKQKIALWYHNYICKVCLYFQKQSKEINNIIKSQEKDYSATLSDQKKKEIAQLLHKLKEEGV